jgi:hypothetical protein
VRFPSIVDARERAGSAATRFPLVLLAAAVAAIAAFFAVDDGSHEELIRLIFSAALGLPLLFALAVTAERRRWSRARGLAVGAVAIALLVLLHLVSRGWPDPQTVTRYVQLAVAFHLLVAVLPFLGVGTLRGFWQFNRILFLRFLLAALYTGVLFAGLAIALLALDNLFGVDVDGIAYLRLFVLLAFVFHPWFFLAGVPRDVAALDELTTYPVGIKVFAQFVLVPLVSVYLLILSAYLVRVLITRTWPSGWIGWLVSSVAAAGTLALLLVHPVRDRPEARWVDAYSRWFYVGLLPSILMLFMAIGLRLGQYGFTERRYFLLVLAVWLAATAVYYAVTASRNIRIIPATLAAIALLTFAGPWSAYAVSRRSQATRLETLLARNGALVDGSLRTVGDDVAFEDAREISAAVRYLVRNHGVASLAAVHPSFADTSGRMAVRSPEITRRPAVDEVGRVVLARVGIDYVNEWEGRAAVSRDFFTSTADLNGPLDVAGYDVLVETDVVRGSPLAIGTDTLAFDSLGAGRFRVRWRGQEVGVLRLDSVIPAVQSGGLARDGLHNVPPSERTLVVESAAVRLRFVIRHIGGSFATDDDPLHINTATADVLIDRR